MVLLALGLPILVWLLVVAAVVYFDFHGGSWFFFTDNGEPLGHFRVNLYQKSEFHLGDPVYGDGDCLNPGCLAGNPRI